MTVRYYSEDHEGTIEPHDSPHEAEAAAEPETSGDQWPEFASDCEWGLMVKLGKAQQLDTREDPSGNFDYLCNYRMVDVDPLPQIREAFPEINRRLDALDEIERDMVRIQGMAGPFSSAFTAQILAIIREAKR